MRDQQHGRPISKAALIFLVLSVARVGVIGSETETSWRLARSGYADEALEASWRAFRSASNAFGEKDPRTVAAARTLSRRHLAVGKLDEGRAFSRYCLNQSEPAILKGETSDPGDIADFAGILVAMGDPLGAKEFLSEAIGTRVKALGEKHPHVATSHAVLGDILFGMGDHDAAEVAYLDSLEICEKALDESDPRLAAALLGVGKCAFELGNRYEAENLVSDALTILKRNLEPDHPRVVEARIWFGTVQNRGFQQPGFLLKDVEKYGSPAITAALFKNGNSRGSTVLDADEAIQFVEGIRWIHGTHHPGFADALEIASRSCINRSRGIEAIRYAREAVETNRLRGSDRTRVFRSSLLWSCGLQLQKRSREAEKVLRQCFADLGFDVQTLRGPLLDANFHLADLLLRTGSSEAGWSRIAWGLKQVFEETWESVPKLSGRHQVEYVRRRTQRHIANAIWLAARKAEKGALPEGFAAEMAEWVINLRGLANEAFATREIHARNSDDPEVRAMAKELGNIRNAIAQIGGAGVGNRPTEGAIRSLFTRLDWLAAQIGSRTSPGTEAPAWVSLERIREKLDPDSALVLFAQAEPHNYPELFQGVRYVVRIPPPGSPGPTRGRPELIRDYVAWVIPPAGKGKVAFHSLGRTTEIDALIARFRGTVAPTAHLKVDPENPFGRPHPLKAPSDALGKSLLEPLLPKLSKFPRWHIIPDGNLWLVPFSALSVGDDKMVIERHAVTFLNTGRELVNPLGERSSNPPAVVANPDYGRPPLDRRHQAVFSELPGTAAEAAAAAPLLKALSGKEPVVLSGKKASEAEVKKLSGPEILLLSTHGFFEPDQSSIWKAPKHPFLRCGLALAGANSPPKNGWGADDGILTGMEVLGLDLTGTRLVVLSACQTGRGDTPAGEGVAGLRQAFELAGAGSVISTLWPVPDQETSQLVSDLFSELAKGEPPGAALRSAQLKMATRCKEATGYPHPHFWAGFVLNGKGR